MVGAARQRGMIATLTVVVLLILLAIMVMGAREVTLAAWLAATRGS